MLRHGRERQRRPVLTIASTTHPTRAGRSAPTECASPVRRSGCSPSVSAAPQPASITRGADEPLLPTHRRASARLPASPAIGDWREYPRQVEIRPVWRRWRGRFCPKAAVRAMPARLLLVCVPAIQEFVASGGGRPWSAPPQCCIAAADGQPWPCRSAWLVAFRCSAAASGPVPRTPVFLGCKPPIRLLLVGQTSYLWSAGDTAFRRERPSY